MNNRDVSGPSMRGGALKVLSLNLDGQLFALEAACVREILDLTPVTEVPAADPFVNGLINVRGKVVPLADLRQKLGMERSPPSIDTRIVVIEIDVDGDLTTVGVLAEKVHEVTEIPEASLEETPRFGLGWRPEFIRCIGKRADGFITVLDIARIFSAAGAGGTRFQTFPGLRAARRNAGSKKPRITIMRATIKLKLAANFTILTALAAMLAWLGISGLGSLNATLDGLISGPVKRMQSADDLRTAVLDILPSRKT